MTLTMVCVMMIVNVDAFGQSCSSCGALSGCSGSTTVACSFVAGSSSAASAPISICIGYKSATNADSSLTFGNLLSTSSTESTNMVIGFGASPSSLLTNGISNSIMIGVNGTVPTMYFEDAGGGDNYGNVGIGNITTPASLLHVRDEVRVGLASTNNGSLKFNNSANGNTVTFQSGATSTSHTYTLPLVAGSDGEVLTYNTGGALSWEEGSSTDAWLIDGNGNTSASTNFLGTTNNVDLVFRTNNAEEMRILASGHVGIGTDTPDGLLHIADPGNTNTDLIIEKAAAGRARLVFQNAGTELANIRLENNEDMVIECDQSNGDILFKVNDGGVDTEVMRINGFSSNVGIGTGSPAQKLHVEATGGASTGAERMAQFSVSDADTDEYVRIGNTNATVGEFSGAIWGRNDNANSAAFSFVATADLDPTANTVPVMLFNSQFGTDPVTNRPLYSWTNDGSAQMTMIANGNLGIGTTNPSGTLEVAGTAYINSFGGGLGNDVGFNTMTSQLIDLGASNSHFKENINDLQFDKEAFFSLRPVSYDWKPVHGGNSDVGFIAEEVGQVFPALSDMRYKHTFLPDGSVLRDTLGRAVVDSTVVEPFGVRYHKLSIYLYMLAKQQDATITELTNRLDGLQAMVESCCAQPAYRMSDEVSTETQHSTKSEKNEFVLLQNDPNPFADYTDIRVSVPESAKNVSLLIVDMKGSVMLNAPVNGTSETIRVYSSDIGKGIFTYYLLSEGNVIASRKMVSSK